MTIDEKMDKFLVDIARAKAELNAKPQANKTIGELIDLLDDYHERGEFHDYTPLEKQRHAQKIQALITEARIKDIERILEAGSDEKWDSSMAGACGEVAKIYKELTQPKGNNGQ